MEIKIKSHCFGGTAHVACSEGKPGEARLRRFGHVQRRDIEYTTGRLELPGRRRPSAKPKRRFIDVVKEDMKLDGGREDDAEDRVGGRHLIGCGNRREEEDQCQNNELCR